MTYRYEGVDYGKPELSDPKIIYSDLWSEFGETPNEIRKYETFWLRWDLSKRYHYQRLERICYYSRNKGLSWIRFVPYYDRNEDFYKKLVKEVIEDRKNFFKERNKEQAKIRRKKLLADAKRKGVSVAEMQKIKTRQRKEKMTKNRQTKQGEVLAMSTNRKMIVGSELKELLDAANKLQEKLLDGSNLELVYLFPRIKHIRKCKEILKKWSNPKNKNNNIVF